MGAQKQHGFTIIEVMLFLGISAVLAVALLAGWSTMLNTQRYRDSNKTLQSFIQQQYNLVYNVENGRSGDFSCDEADGVQPENINGVDRGQTDCVLMGRYIHIDRGTDLEVFPIIGFEPSDPPTTNDSESIEAHEPKIANNVLGLTESELNIPWGATVVNSGGNPQSAVIAIVRSPLTGTVHTYVDFTAADVTPDLFGDDDLASSSNETELVLCLDAGAPLSGGQMGVVVQARAAAQSAILTSEQVC